MVRLFLKKEGRYHINITSLFPFETRRKNVFTYHSDLEEKFEMQVHILFSEHQELLESY